MSKKKIHFNNKPITIENNKGIDEWVKGETYSNKKELEEKNFDKKLTFSIPEALHKKLKIECVKNSITVRDFLINIIEKNLTE